MNMIIVDRPAYRANKAIRLARKNLTGAIQETSARGCLANAVALFDRGEFEYAHRRALRSMAYSVGMFHPDYKACQ